MKAIVIEDNISDSVNCQMILEELNIDLQGAYISWKEALPNIKNEKPDFMIVDLKLAPHENSIYYLRQINELNIPAIICTAFSTQEYANKALDVGAIAFVPKPINNATLSFQIKKLVNEIESNIYDQKDFLLVRHKGSLIKVFFKDIIKIEIEGNYSYVYLKSGKKYVLKKSLKSLLHILDPELFVRCHRTSIVNTSYVKSMNLTENKLYMLDGTDLPVGSRFRSKIKSTFTS